VFCIFYSLDPCAKWIGIGVGLVTNLLPAIIAQYFGKQRAIACGISYAGSTTGAFIFPLFIEWQLNKYGLSGTLLLMGGMDGYHNLLIMLMKHTVYKTHSISFAYRVHRYYTSRIDRCIAFASN